MKKPDNTSEKSRKVVTARYLGLSSDGRTGRWSVTCVFDNCGHVFHPPTTRMAHQTMDCPKCNGEQHINYNEIA